MRLTPDVPSASSFSQNMAATESPLFTPSPESITTASTSMSTLDLEEVIVSEDPQYREHSHSCQSRVYVEDNSPVIHVPPFSPYHQLTLNGPHTPPYSYENSYIPGKLLDFFKPHSSTRSSTKQKFLKYKSLFNYFFLQKDK